uniref:hypothetical protein n=1 Tax=Ruminococcus bromii TaxID=40518 RepID=UPI003FEFC9B8
VSVIKYSSFDIIIFLHGIPFTYLLKFRLVFFFLKMGNPDWNCPYILKIMRFLRLCTVSSTIWCICVFSELFHK